MPDSQPKFIDGLSYTALGLRRGDIVNGMHDGSGVGVRGGVRPGGSGLNVTLAGSTITVAAGAAMMQYQAGQGVYRACLASSTNLTLNAAHATLSRIDLVYLRVWDNTVDAAGLSQADAVYLAGTAASSPVAPTPTGTQIYIPLATITVPPSGGGSATVSTAVRPFTVAPGGILPATSAPSSPYVGQYYDDGSNLLRWNGSSWDTYQKMPGAATSWTPTWSTSSGAHLPSYGNAAVDCRYFKFGRLVTFNFSIIFGSTTNFGSGVVGSDNWTFSLPFTAASTTYPIGKASMEPGTSKAVSGIAQTTSDGTAMMIYVDSGRPDGGAVTAGIADSISPWTWASTNKLVILGQYESTT